MLTQPTWPQPAAVALTAPRQTQRPRCHRDAKLKSKIGVRPRPQPLHAILLKPRQTQRPRCHRDAKLKIKIGVRPRPQPLHAILLKPRQTQRPRCHRDAKLKIKIGVRPRPQPLHAILKPRQTQRPRCHRDAKLKIKIGVRPRPQPLHILVLPPPPCRPCTASPRCGASASSSFFVPQTKRAAAHSSRAPSLTRGDEQNTPRPLGELATLSSSSQPTPAASPASSAGSTPVLAFPELVVVIAHPKQQAFLALVPIVAATASFTIAAFPHGCLRQGLARVSASS